jgi:uncharacterized protein (TIGR03435 family)
MRTLILFTALIAHAQTLEIASIRRVTQPVGPDYNNKIVYSENAFSAHNITLARLVAEAYRLQLSQISGPKWITSNEYEIEARAASRVSPAMLQALLAERFQLKTHPDTKTLSAYELTVDRGFKVPTSKTGFHFTGDMRAFADLIGVQLTIPEGHDPSRPTIGSAVPMLVIDKTGLTGTYDFFLPLGPGVDLTRQVREELGLRLDNRRAPVEVLTVDSALQTPTPN